MPTLKLKTLTLIATFAALFSSAFLLITMMTTTSLPYMILSGVFLLIVVILYSLVILTFLTLCLSRLVVVTLAEPLRHMKSTPQEWKEEMDKIEKLLKEETIGLQDD